MTTRLSDIVAALDAHIRHVRWLGLKQPALLLEMAKLDLQMRIHDISDVELDELCRTIEHLDDETIPVSAPAPASRIDTTASTVVSLFGDSRFSPHSKATADTQNAELSRRGESGLRGKTLVPR